MTKYVCNVRTRREKLLLSQESLARAVGVSRQTIVAIERGAQQPKILLALRIARELRTDVHRLWVKR